MRERWLFRVAQSLSWKSIPLLLSEPSEWNVSHGNIHLNPASDPLVECSFHVFLSFWQTSFWLNATFWIINVLYTHHVFHFHSWLLELYIHMQHSETSVILFSAKSFHSNFYTDYWNFLDSNITNSSGKYMKSCHADQELMIHTQILHLEMKFMIKTIKLRIVLNPSKVKYLWKRIQTTENTQQNPQQITESSFSEILTAQIQTPSV